MYFDIDGTLPQPRAQPAPRGEPPNDPRERVVAEKADLGIAWDGDADRCFFIDENGEFVPGDFVTALLAEALLAKHPGATILYDLRASRAVPDVVHANGGVALMNRVGHAFFKQRMRREPVLFGGEVSGHYYFQPEDYNADSGFIPALLILELLSKKGATHGRAARAAARPYFISRRDQLDAWTTSRRAGAHRAALRRRRDRPRSTASRGLSRLALQRAAVEHRAAAAPQPRRRQRGADARRSATLSSVSSGGPEVAGDARADALGAEARARLDPGDMLGAIAGLPGAAGAQATKPPGPPSPVRPSGPGSIRGPAGSWSAAWEAPP